MASTYINRQEEFQSQASLQNGSDSANFITERLSKVINISKRKGSQEALKEVQGIRVFSGRLMLLFLPSAEQILFSFRNNHAPDLLPGILPRVAQEDYMQGRCLKVKGSA